MTKRLTGIEEHEEEYEKETIKVFGTHVYFYSEVTKKSILELKEKLDEARKNCNENSKKKKIFLFIHSEGGDAFAGISGMNMISSYNCKIITVVDGFVASAATLLFLAGKKRYVTNHSQFLIHQLRTSFLGKYEDLKDEVKNSTSLMDSIIKIYTDKTNMKIQLIKTYLNKELSFTSDECLKYGIAHKIMI